MILEAGYTSAITFEVYRVSITYYRKPGRLLGKFVGIGATTSIAGTPSSAIYKGSTSLELYFFSTCLWRLLPTPYSFLGLFCIFVSFLKFVGTVYLTVEETTLSDLQLCHKRNNWLISVTLIASVATGAITAASMIYYLSTQRGKSMRR